MSIPISELIYIYGDNMPVIHNTSKMRESFTGHMRAEDNPADLLIKMSLDRCESMLCQKCYTTYMTRIPKNQQEQSANMFHG